MLHKSLSIRAFIGAKDFTISRKFYTELGFTENVIDPNFSYFIIHDKQGFYLQNAYVKDWVDNTMLFVEVENAGTYYKELKELNQHDLMFRPRF